VVAWTAPSASVDVAGVGLPSTIKLSSPVAGVTAFGYQLPGEAEVKVPAVDGKGSGQITFPKVGYYDIAVRSYVGAKLIGADTLPVSVSDAPEVESAEFTLDHDVVEGTTGTFTFKPRAAGVKGYVYDFGSGQQRIDAAADGSAVLPWTAKGGFYDLVVESVLADGSLSQPTQYEFDVIPAMPTVSAPDLNNWPRTDGVGAPLDIEMESRLPNLAGFVYIFNGGAEQTVASNGNTGVRVSVVPDHAGDNTIVVRALLADGSRSPETTYTFSVWSGPLVTWSPPGSGTVGKPMTLSFRPALPGVTAYRYSIYNGPETTVAAATDGTATVSYTPTSWGAVNVTVRSVGADGTESQARTVYLDVRDNKVSVYSAYDTYNAKGGIGWTANFQFITQLFGEVVEYRYHLNDGAEQVLPASTEGVGTWTSITLDRDGLNTLYVQSRTAAGDLSPVTAYPFLVGTAPHVASPQYPEGQWAGGGGVTGTFEFSGGTAGIVSFDYHVDQGAAVTVDADADGRATATYTPAADFEQHTMYVTGHRADGTATDPTSYTFYVSNQH